MTAQTDTPAKLSAGYPDAEDKRLTVGATTNTTAMLAMAFILTIAGWVWVSRIEPLPNFSDMEVAAKKQSFFNYLTPYIEDANQDIRADRARLKSIAEQDGDLSWWQSRYLEELAAAYDIDIPIEEQADLLRELQIRVDTVPPALALAQAAKESGWGTSRFARAGYNLFGQHCFEPGCGFVPKARNKGRRHEVAKFTSVSEAVEAYLYNLNTHHRYAGLRKMRAKLRQSGEKLSGLRLADGLLAYSERGKKYINEIKGMIRSNELE